MDDLLQDFISETRETLEALSGEIVAWEAAPDDRARLDSIFRFVHTVKGSCGFLDLPRLAKLSHAAEDVLAAVRSGERIADTQMVNAVLAIIDRIGELVEAIDAGRGLDDSGEEGLIAALAEGAVAQAPIASIAPRAPTRSVRLGVELLDRMMSGMSDMVLARNELVRRLRDGATDPAVEASLQRLSATVAEMRDTVTRTRMQKIDTLFSALPRMARDTAAALGKSVVLSIEGGDVELDREMIEMIRDPLTHIVRNAIDHGIEAPDERRARGKPETGRLIVAARQSGNQIIVEITDDGRGIDVARVVAKLVEMGAGTERELRALSERAKVELIFEPGLTTAPEVTSVSGRGVGMDVVRANVEQIGGRIDIVNAPGKGVTIAIHVPLTLSIIPTIGVGVGTQRFAVPRQAIEEIVRVGAAAIRIDMLGDTATATIRNRRIPLIELGATLAIADRAAAPSMLVVVSVAGGSFALAVDTVLDHEELVIKPAAPCVMAAGIFAGQTLPDSGEPMLLLDCAGIANRAGLMFDRTAAAAAEVSAADTEPSVPALLFEDLDGGRRLIPLAIIDRVEIVPTTAIRFGAGRLLVSVEGRLLPLVTHGEWQARAAVSIARLRDGTSEIAYAIGEAVDIVDIPPTMVPARAPGMIAGVVVLHDDQFELIDVHWLFATHGDRSGEESPPICLIGGAESAWMMTFLKPALESTGYRVTTRLKEGEAAAVMLTMDDGDSDCGSLPVIRLRREPSAIDAGDTSIYRYDRPGLIAALAESTRGAGR